MVLFGLELVVTDTVRLCTSRGSRCSSSGSLCATMTCSGLLPASMVVTAEGLHATLPRTKTSGPGKRAAVLTATISSDAPVGESEVCCQRALPFGSASRPIGTTFCPAAAPDLPGVRDCYASYDGRVSTTSYAGRYCVPSEDGRGQQIRRCSARVQAEFGQSIPNATVSRAWELLWDLARHSESTWDVGRPTAQKGTSGLRQLLCTRFRASARVHCARVLARRISSRSFELLADLDKFLEAKGYSTDAREHQKETLQFFKDREGLLSASSEAAGDDRAAEVSEVDVEAVLEGLPPLPGHYFITLTAARQNTQAPSLRVLPNSSRHKLQPLGGLRRGPPATREIHGCVPEVLASTASSSSSSAGTRSSSSSESI